MRKLEMHTVFGCRQLTNNPTIIQIPVCLERPCFTTRRTAKIPKINAAQLKRSFLAFGILVTAPLFLAPAAVHAQVLYGSLTGRVTDASDAAVPGVAVLTLNGGTGEIREAETDGSGLYSFPSLQPGVYKIGFSSKPFANTARDGVEIEANRQRRIDVTMTVEPISTEISEHKDAIQADRADLSANLTSRQVVDLPVSGTSGRNFQSLMTLVPGAVMAGEQNSAAGNPQRAISFNLNGVSRMQNNTRVDGSSIVYAWLPTNIAYVPPTEAIQAVNIVTNSFNAEQGLAGGGAISVSTKSGTNEFHGSAWIYDTNSYFKARNFFQTTPQNPKDILNQFGFAAGGPVWIPGVFHGRNKLFFFVDWERTTRRQTSPVRFYSLATSDIRNGDFTRASTTIYDPASNADPTRRSPFPGNRIPANRIDPAAAIMTALLPQTNLPGDFNNYTAAGTGTYDRDNIDIKINEHVNDKLMYFGRYSISPSQIFDPPALGRAGGDALNGGQAGNAPGRIQVAGAGLTYVIRPSLLLDANAGYTRQRLGAENVDIGTNFGLDVLKIPGTNGPDRLQGGIPSFQFPNLWANLGNPNTGNPFLFRDNQYVASGSLAWIRASHNLRFGWDYQNQQLNHFQPQGGTFQTARGTFTFNGQSTALQNGAPADRFNGWADFLLGEAATAGKVVQFLNPDSLRMHAYALYAQDQWQFSRALTFNYGLRWEWYPFPRRDHGGVSRFDPATGNVYVGGHQGIPDDTGASSGPGEFLPRLGVAYRLSRKTVIRAAYGLSADPRPFIDFRNSYPIVSAWQVTPSDNPFIAATTLRLGLQEQIYGQTPDLTQGVIKLPSGTGTVTFPKEAMRKYIQSWNFMIEREFAGFTGQAGYVGARAVGQQGFININAGAPGAGNSGRLLAPLGLFADITEVKPFKTTTYDALQSQLTRRWGSSLGGVVYTFSKAIDYADNDAGPRIQWPAAWSLNRGPAGYDRTHNFQAYWVWDAPFGKGQKWAKHGFAGHVLGGWQLNGILSAESGQPILIVQNTANNLNAGGTQQVPDQVKSEVAIFGGVGKDNPYFDTSAFASVNIPAGQPQRFGNAGRNNVRGPGLFDFDMGLFRTFTLKERYRLQFRAEAVNVLNHPSFANPSGNVSDKSSFGFVTSTLGASAVTGTGERQFRFAARVSF
jgi:Carboxypeptidase regulatory-like domain/TonB dependent receptor